jgi:hypothetical protein
MIQVFIGDIYESLATHAKSVDPHAKLFQNPSDLNNDCDTYYTCIADCGIENFYNVLNASDVIHYIEPDTWSDATSSNKRSMKFWTEKVLDIFVECPTKKVKGYNRKNYAISPIEHNFLELTDIRKTDGKQLWIAGCSVAHGIGVEKEQRFGQLIANALDLPVSWLTKGSTSILWARDQILRSDIRHDDIVCWGITNTVRLPYYYKNKVQHVWSGFYEDNKWLNEIINIEKLDDKDQLYQCVTAMHQVKNFCDKVGAKLFMLDMCKGDQNKIRGYCHDLKNFKICLLDNDCDLDLGSDQLHPGPLQHIAYAKHFLTMINNEC